MFLFPCRVAWRAFIPMLLLLSTACGGSSHSDTPLIRQFQATPARVSQGEKVTLLGSFAHGAGTVEPAVGPVADGEPVTVAPKTSTTYTLRVTNAAGNSATASAQVVVAPGLAIRILGCEGAVGNVKVQGPGGFIRTLSASAALPDIEPGEYTVSALPADLGATRLHPLHDVQKVQVASGTEVTVHYLSPTLTVYLPGAIPLEFVLAPPGTFTMGSNEGDPRYYPSHRPPHPVTIARPFYVAKFPTTQAQWEAVVGDNPSTLRHPDYPVNAVSYDRIQSEFLPALNRKLPGYDFRLPTEAEWEYACRAGTTTDRFFGPEGKVEDYAWVHKPGESYLHPVGLKKPNPWWLYDLTGQVFQWCLDYAHDGYLDALGDGTAWLEPERNIPERIARGYGPLLIPYDQVSSSKRWSFCPSMTSDYIGFRIVISNILN